MKMLLKSLRMTLCVAGSIFFLLVGLAFTSAPFWTWYGMAAKKAGITRPPEYIVLLGGGGMPSESGLMRTWYTAGVANYFTRAKIIVALPGNPGDSLGALALMKEELVRRGISPERISFEDSGTNTRSQALFVLKRILNIERNGTPASPEQLIRSRALLIVTSPEHLFRAVRTFQKAGFKKVDGIPAFEQDIGSDMTFSTLKLGGRRFIPDIGSSITLRYQFWTQLKYEILILREWTALTYYKLLGWI